MKTYSIGETVGSRGDHIPTSFLTESVIGQSYEIKIETRGVPDPSETAKVLAYELKKRFNAKLHYFGVDDNTITMQIEGSPFVWNTLLIFLPEILQVLGIIVGIIAVYFIASDISPWLYGVAAVGLFLVFFGPQAISKRAMLRRIERD